MQHGSEVSLGDPNILDPSDEDVSAGFYGGADEFKKAQRKGDFKPREGLYAVVGVGYSHVKNGDVEAVVKGPNIGFGASGSSDGARLFYNAEAISTSLSVGPAKATVGLSANTGVDISATQVEAKFLGTGFSFGRKMGFSLYGSGFELELW